MKWCMVNCGRQLAVNKNVFSTEAVVPAALTVESVPFGPKRVLVIEDDRAVQKALKRLFEAEGFTVDISGNGDAGLRMFWEAKPTVLILDLRLPGIPGEDVCREISRASPSVPIIILSGRTEVMDKVLLLELGLLPQRRQRDERDHEHDRRRPAEQPHRDRQIGLAHDPVRLGARREQERRDADAGAER